MQGTKLFWIMMSAVLCLASSSLLFAVPPGGSQRMPLAEFLDPIAREGRVDPETLRRSAADVLRLSGRYSDSDIRRVTEGDGGAYHRELETRMISDLLQSESFRESIRSSLRPGAEFHLERLEDFARSARVALARLERRDSLEPGAPPPRTAPIARTTEPPRRTSADETGPIPLTRHRDHERAARESLGQLSNALSTLVGFARSRSDASQRLADARASSADARTISRLETEFRETGDSLSVARAEATNLASRLLDSLGCIYETRRSSGGATEFVITDFTSSVRPEIRDYLQSVRESQFAGYEMLMPADPTGATPPVIHPSFAVNVSDRLPLRARHVNGRDNLIELGETELMAMLRLVLRAR